MREESWSGDGTPLWENLWHWKGELQILLICASHLRMDKLKGLTRWRRKLLLSKICCHNLKNGTHWNTNNTSVSERLTSIFLSPIPRLFVCLQDTGRKWIVWNNVLFENALEGSQLLNYLTASAPLLDWCEVLIIALREVNHHVLAALRQLPHTPARRPRIPGKKISFNCTIDNLTC